MYTVAEFPEKVQPVKVLELALDMYTPSTEFPEKVQPVKVLKWQLTCIPRRTSSRRRCNR